MNNDHCSSTYDALYRADNKSSFYQFQQLFPGPFPRIFTSDDVVSDAALSVEDRCKANTD